MGKGTQDHSTAQITNKDTAVDFTSQNVTFDVCEHNLLYNTQSYDVSVKSDVTSSYKHSSLNKLNEGIIPAITLTEALFHWPIRQIILLTVCAIYILVVVPLMVTYILDSTIRSSQVEPDSLSIDGSQSTRLGPSAGMYPESLNTRMRALLATAGVLVIVFLLLLCMHVVLCYSKGHTYRNYTRVITTWNSYESWCRSSENYISS